VLKIGDFARLSHVSVVTLRHYDEIGLLPPAAVDHVTGYRYYAATQMPRLHRILALKDLGFSLEQIARVLHSGVTPDQLRGMLLLKQAEVEQRVAAEQARVRRIAALVHQIEQEEIMPEYAVALKTVPALRVAARRVRIPRNDEVPAYLGPAFLEVSDYVKRQGAKEVGPCLALWYQPAAVLADEEAEAAVPIDRLLPSTDRVQVYEISEAQVASAIHLGDFAEFPLMHAALLTWIDANGYRITGPYREVYVQYDRRDMGGAATEIQYPVEKGV
jgi:DNA-binding transcriptional MerR regulator